MAQQPLSAQVRELEREIGYDLFERYANRIRRTPAGHVFLSEVRVGYCGTAMDHVLPATMRILKEKYPDIGFDLHELSHTKQIVAIQRGELDVGFVYRPIDDRTFDSIDLFDELVVVVAPAGHPLGAHDRVSSSQLTGMPLIAISADENSTYTALLSEALAEISSQASSKISANDRGSALGLVAHGFGITLLPQYAATRRSGVTYIPLDPPVHLRFAVIWSKLDCGGVLRTRFLEAVAAAAAEAGSAPAFPTAPDASLLDIEPALR